MQMLLQHYSQILFTAKQFHTLCVCVLIPNATICICSPGQAQQWDLAWRKSPLPQTGLANEWTTNPSPFTYCSWSQYMSVCPVRDGIECETSRDQFCIFLWGICMCVCKFMFTLCVCPGDPQEKHRKKCQCVCVCVSTLNYQPFSPPALSIAIQ